MFDLEGGNSKYNMASHHSSSSTLGLDLDSSTTSSLHVSEDTVQTTSSDRGLSNGNGSSSATSSKSISTPSKWWKSSSDRNGAVAMTPSDDKKRALMALHDHSLSLHEDGSEPVLPTEPSSHGGDYAMYTTAHGVTPSSNNSTTSSSGAKAKANRLLIRSIRYRLFGGKKNQAYYDENERFGGDEYFVKRTRASYLEAHQSLNGSILQYRTGSKGDSYKKQYEEEEDFDEGSDVEVHSSANLMIPKNQFTSKPIAVTPGINNSSLSFVYEGKVQIRLPKDDVRLIMDPFIEPGILSVERNAGRKVSGLDLASSGFQSEDVENQLNGSHDHRNDSDTVLDKTDTDVDAYYNRFTQRTLKAVPQLTYVLTIDQELYKRVVQEISDSQIPCGFYYCCHGGDDKDQSVSINVALLIVFILFSVFFFYAFISPDSAYVP